MKIEKFCTVTQNNNCKSFGLFRCNAKKKDGELVLTKILDRLEIGSNPSALAATGEKLGLIVVNPPTAKSVYIMRGTRQFDGEILDPLVDWNGKVIEKCPRSRGTIARAIEVAAAIGKGAEAARAAAAGRSLRVGERSGASNPERKNQK